MTIPIRPGPWSFLLPAGQAVGGYLQGREQKRQSIRQEGQEDRAEALKQLGTVFEAVQNNQLSASALKSPFFQSLVARSGIAEQFSPSLVAPKPEEDLRAGQSDYFKQMFGGSPGGPVSIPGSAAGGLDQTINLPPRAGGTPAEREAVLAAGRPVTRAEVAKNQETELTAGARSGVLRAGGAAGRAVAGVLPENVATAGEVAAQEPLYNSVAGRSVDASITTLKIGRLTPGNAVQVSDAAWQLAQRDAKSRGFVLDEELTRPYIDAVIQSRLREQELMDVRRMAAAQPRGGGGDDYAKLVSLYQRQQQLIQDSEESLDDPGELTRILANGIANEAQKKGVDIEAVLNDPKTSAARKDAYYRVQAYDEAKARLRTERQNVGDNFTQLVGGQVGAPDPNAVPMQSGRRGQPGFQSAPVPGNQANPQPSDATAQRPTPERQAASEASLNQRRSARFQALAAIERAKPANKRRSPEELKEQVLREIK